MKPYCDCGNKAEGSTGKCASCNRAERRLSMKEENGFQTGIQPRSESRAKEETLYLRKAKSWLKGRECALKGHVTPCNGRLTVHHQKGRIGELLLDENYWLPACLEHHRYIETHPTEAYQEGWSLLRTANEPHLI